MAQLIGLARIGRDAELRYTQDGKAVTNLSLAFSYGKKQDGKRPTQWVDAVMFGARAESLAQYLTKGSLVYVALDDAHIETYQTQDGRQGSKLAGSVSAIEFAARPPGQDQGAQPHQPQQTRQAPARPQTPARSSSLDDMSSDIPF